MTSNIVKSKLTLLGTITHCPNVKAHFRNQATPCREIIDSQGMSTLEDFQVPEPWNGKIERAPLLFISSNPSISEKEQYPSWNAPETRLQDFFQHRFGGGEKQWVKDGKYALTQDGSYERATPYWSEIKNRAFELLSKKAVPGTDYAISEIVHCKSRNNIGVDEALKECAQRYLSRVLEISSAAVVVYVGKKAEHYIKDVLEINENQSLVGPLMHGGRKRLILFLPAPGSSLPRKIDKVFSKEEQEMIRSFLAEAA